VGIGMLYDLQNRNVFCLIYFVDLDGVQCYSVVEQDVSWRFSLCNVPRLNCIHTATISVYN